MTIAQEAGDVALPVVARRGPDTFSSRHARGHVERLHYPRRAGTPAERLAVGYLLGAFAAQGLPCRREPFPVPFVAREVGARIVFAGCAALTMLGAWSAASRPPVAAACWAAAGLLVNAPWRLTGATRCRWPTRMSSENLVAALPGDGVEGAPARVVFMAHHDTKSQCLPTGVRVGLVVAASAACGLLALCGLAAAAGATALGSGAIPRTFSAVAAACLSVLAVNLTGNRSPGALDNGSGLGTLLELARTWRPRPGAPVEVLWVATGSEEVGLDGARELLRRHERWWREKPTLLINLDSVGVGDRLYLAGEPGALRLARETADRLGLRWARLRSLGAGMDHEPFAARGLTALSLLGDVVGVSLALHSRRDTLDLVDRSALDRAGCLASHIAWEWADRNRPADRVDERIATPTRGMAIALGAVGGG